MDGDDQSPRENELFEKRVGEYFKSGVGVDRADQSFALDTSF